MKSDWDNDDGLDRIPGQAGIPDFINAIPKEYHRLVRLLLKNEEAGLDRMIAKNFWDLRRLCSIAEGEEFELDVLSHADEFEGIKTRIETNARKTLVRNKDWITQQMVSNLLDEQKFEFRLFQLQLETIQSMAKLGHIPEAFEPLMTLYGEKHPPVSDLIFETLAIMTELHPSEERANWFVTQVEKMSNTSYSQYKDLIKRVVAGNPIFQKLILNANVRFSEENDYDNSRMRDLLVSSVIGTDEPMQISRLINLVELCDGIYQSGKPDGITCAIELIGKAQNTTMVAPDEFELRTLADAIKRLIGSAGGEYLFELMKIFVKCGGNITENDPTKPMFPRPDKWLHLLAEEKREPTMRVWVDAYERAANEGAKKERPMEEHPEALQRFRRPDREPGRGLFHQARLRRAVA